MRVKGIGGINFRPRHLYENNNVKKNEITQITNKDKIFPQKLARNLAFRLKSFLSVHKSFASFSLSLSFSPNQEIIYFLITRKRNSVNISKIFMSSD